jgi:S-adenosylmethionine hydrolase
MSPIITLTTDFGMGSPYVAAMKGVILSLARQATIVDISHAIAPQDIRAAALVLAEVTPRFPAETVHVAVVDPGVGSARRLIYCRFGTQQYVGPDNGLFSCLARREPPSTIIAIERPEFWLPEVSHTFHGRDIMAPVAARLAQGLDPAHLGPRIASLTSLDWPEVQVLPQKIIGTVTSIDSFGNVITDITAAQLASAPTDERLRVECDEHETFGLFKTYADQPPMTLVAVISSSGVLEVALVGDNAAEMLGIRRGAKVVVSW